jgi:hypothetical protein
MIIFAKVYMVKVYMAKVYLARGYLPHGSMVRWFTPLNTSLPHGFLER